jgi:EpsI family protein
MKPKNDWCNVSVEPSEPTVEHGAPPAIEKSKVQVGRQLFLRVLAIAAIAYVILAYADGFLALPLREISSVIASWILDIIGYPVERRGTILATERFSFEVVPACSGSTALRVLIAVGIIIAGTHTRLNALRRVIAVILAIPIALIANGARVSALVAIGDARLQPVEGWPHDLIGLCVFFGALAVFALSVELLSIGVKRENKAPPMALQVVAWILWAIPFIPMWLWCVAAWANSPLDYGGWLGWLVAAGGGGLVCWRCGLMAHLAQTQRLHGAILLSASALLLLLGGLLDIYAVQAAAWLTSLAGIILLIRGWRALLLLSPWLAVVGLGMPIVGFQVTNLFGWHGAFASAALRGVLLLCFALCGVVLFIKLRPQSPLNAETVESASTTRMPLWSAGLVAILSVTFAGHTFLVNRGGGLLNEQRVRLDYLQGDWVGYDMALDANTASILGRDRVLMRQYVHNDQGVMLLVSSTGGDRHRAHPPEYCLTGAGWQVRSQEADVVQLANVPDVSATTLRLENENDETMHFVYWFSDGDIIVPSYRGMLVEDTKRRLLGQRTDWFLFRFYALDEQYLHDFMSQCAPYFEPVIN